MRTTNIQISVLAVLLAACGQTRFEDYYTGDGPEFSGISQASEAGNTGGDIVTLKGSGFGEDPGRVTVVFGSTNAHVRAVSDGAIEVVVPRGPLEGGVVAVTIATPEGQARQEGAYTYDMAPGFGADPFADEVAYLAVTNDWLSCLGGLGKADDTEFAPFGGLFSESPSAPLPADVSALLVGNPDHQFCGMDGYSSPFTGQTGIAARTEGLDVALGRLHTVYAGERVGYGGSWDMSWERWSVQTPSQEVISVDIEGAVEDLRRDLGTVSIENRTIQDALGNDTAFCLDDSALGTFEVLADGLNARGGANNGGVVPLHGDRYTSVDGACDRGEGRAYDLGELRFCEIEEYDTPRSLTWEAEWPVGQNFFQGWDEGADAPDDRAPTRLALHVSGLGIDGLEVVVPPPIEPTGRSTEDRGGETGLFLFAGPSGARCPTGHDEPQGSSNTAFMSWEPADIGRDEQPAGSSIRYVRSWVRFTIHHLPLSWLGPSPGELKATITVPDRYQVDDETGRSTLAIPAWVMMQFPSVDFGPDETLPAGSAELADTAYLAYSAERVTEYVIELGDSESMTFAYSTGDIGFSFLSTAWANPLELGSCGDCSDSDGDGWIDGDDPDCVSGESEGNQTFGLHTCNDGIDNDGDGVIDADDDDCEDGSDSEGNCTDRADNDGDGWVDEGDPDCDEGELEAGFTDLPCNDGLDNDGDGWLDGDDPACGDAGDEEDDGFGTWDCNDGLDNDGDGRIDAEDPGCNSALDATE